MIRPWRQGFRLEPLPLRFDRHGPRDKGFLYKACCSWSALISPAGTLSETRQNPGRKLSCSRSPEFSAEEGLENHHADSGDQGSSLSLRWSPSRSPGLPRAPLTRIAQRFRAVRGACSEPPEQWSLTWKIALVQGLPPLRRAARQSGFRDVRPRRPVRRPRRRIRVQRRHRPQSARRHGAASWPTPAASAAGPCAG